MSTSQPSPPLPDAVVTAEDEAHADATLRRSIGRGVAWATVSNLVMRMSGIAVTAVVARLLSPTEFGTFAVALAVFVVVTSLAELGMASAVARSPLEPSEIAGTVTSISIIVSMALASLMAATAQPLASLLGTPEAAEAIRILALCLGLTGFFAVPGAQLTREFRQDRILIGTLAGFVPANVLLVVLALQGHGADAFAWSRVLGQLVTGLVFVAFTSRRYRPQWRPALVIPLLTFGLPLALANLVNWMLLNADYLIISRILTTEEVGVYMIAFTVASWSTAVLGSVLNGVVMPAFGRFSEDAERLKQSMVTAIRLVALVALPTATVTLALAPSLVRTMFGEQWLAAAPVLRVLALYGACFAFSLVLVNMLVAVGATSRLLAVQMAWVCVLVPAMIAAAEVAGLVGVAWAHVVVIVLIALPGYAWALRSRLGSLPSAMATTVAGPAMVSAAAGGAAWFVDRWVADPVAGFVLGGAAALTVFLLGASRMITATIPESAALARRLGRPLRRRRVAA